MFTGIVQNTGSVLAITPRPGGVGLQVALGEAGEGLHPGDSVACNGVCLTAVAVADGAARFDVITETLSKTTLGRLVVGSRVNLERSLRVGALLDGHIVQGHVDGVGVVCERIASASEFKLWITPPVGLAKYLPPRGSVALDGVSLTIAEVQNDSFAVALIPTTLDRTNMGDRHVGEGLNIETDIISRQVVFWLERQQGHPGR